MSKKAYTVILDEDWDETPHELLSPDEPDDYSWFDVSDEDSLDDPTVASP